jgi:hypothetical protein
MLDFVVAVQRIEGVNEAESVCYVARSPAVQHHLMDDLVVSDVDRDRVGFNAWRT